MKLSMHVIITAGVVVIASAGVLYPINTTIDDLNAEIEVLEAERTGDELVSAELRATQERIEEVEKQLDDRTKILCVNSAAGRHAVENAVHERVSRSGLRRVSIDRENNPMGPETPAFGLSLIVEGDGFALHKFLVGLESLKWVTRVLSLAVQPGKEHRRITMKIAVLLESNES